MSLALLGGRPIRTRPFASWPVFGKTEERRLLQCLRSGHWGKLSGQEVATFEQRFAQMHGCRFGIGVVNGTVSLRLALLAGKIQAGDEVIVPPYTFYSTASAVLEANAIPVFADVNLETFNLDPQAVAAAITRRTRAIIPVHFAGQVAEMQPLLALAKKHRLLVIEDAAHAHGALWKNRPAGSIGHLGSFSFQSSKNLTAGEGGIITTNDAALAEACRSLHNCGRIPRGKWYEHHLLAGNYRLGEFQGAILNSQLDRLEAQTKKRDANGQYLAARISRLPGIFPQRRNRDCTRHSYHLFMLRLEANAFGVDRAQALAALQAEGIPCSAGYPISLHRQPLFQKSAFGPYLPKAVGRFDPGRADCPNSDRICRAEGIWLEQSLFLGSRSDMNDIADAFEKIFEHRALLTSSSSPRDGSEALLGSSSSPRDEGAGRGPRRGVRSRRAPLPKRPLAPSSRMEGTR